MTASEPARGLRGHAGDAGSPAGGEPPFLVEIGGEPHCAIWGVEGMEPFLMTVASAGDFWIFAGSNSPFTAGRGDPDRALFPYETADKILRHADSAGALTKLWCGEVLWEPWHAPAAGVERNLYKHVAGNGLVFEEIHPGLSLRFRWSLAASDAHGLVRRCSLENFGDAALEARVLDGFFRMLPPGVTQEMYSRYSYLAEAYMRHELDGPLAIYTLNSRVTDRAEPAESLRAACAWSWGWRRPKILLSERQVAAFRRGEPVREEREIRGALGAYLVEEEVRLGPGESVEWMAVADTGLDHAALDALRGELEDPASLAGAVREGLARDARALRGLVAGADGLQVSEDRVACAHHFANAMFNGMRGGLPVAGYRFPASDFRRFVRERSRPVSERRADWLAGLPEEMDVVALRASAREAGDPGLERLATEYLPLAFGRRHGDPSRPWNRFSIAVKDAAGDPVYGYQGNWRDLFQNWESMARSYPAFLESMIAVFLNASTADGYNPYRITRAGFEWEVFDEADPWSHIGYWGDHQIVYLLRLLESRERFDPGRLAAGLRERRSVSARLPYEIAGFARLAEDPAHSIAFDARLHAELIARAEAEGNDGKLLRGADGEPARFTLGEKLLVPALVKLSNFVPGGGIWLNTQRPEWNDGNNALAGWGLSVVTSCHLARYARFAAGLFDAAPGGACELSPHTARLLREVGGALEGLDGRVSAGMGGAERFGWVEKLSLAGERHRGAVYRGEIGEPVEVGAEEIARVLRAAERVLAETVRANVRPDGMVHGYNLLELRGGEARVRHLGLMLEGQAAAVGSGILEPGEELRLLRALRASPLYREDQASYLLSPDREIAPFLGRNRLPGDAALTEPLVGALLDAGDRTIVVPGRGGAIHFQADLQNARELAARLDRLAERPGWGERVAAGRAGVLALWERAFRHGEFTGRSGSMFGFEGLGCIYWHMVAKLLLAAQESHARALREGAAADVTEGLAEAYREIRAGLGFCKTPERYGAFPTDPYSHTPAHRGAQQPGMTGQVKEEILTRLGELGVEVDGGCLRFAPALLGREEFLACGGLFAAVGSCGREVIVELPRDAMAFTFCQVPVVYRIGETPSLLVERANGERAEFPGNRLMAAESAAIFSRDGSIERLVVTFPEGALRMWKPLGGPPSAP